MSNITFNLKRKWFDLVESGLKREEYREITAFWVARLMHDCSINKPKINKLNAQEIANLLNNGLSIAESGWRFKPFETVTNCLGYPAGEDMSRRRYFLHKGTEIGYAKEGIGKELVGDQLVFVIKFEDL